MALTSGSWMAEGGYGSTLATKFDKIDCSQILAAVLKADRELLGHIKMGPVANNIECNWIEDELVSNSFEAQITTSVSLTLITAITTASLCNMVRANDTIVASDGEMYARVGSTPTTGSVITVASYSSTVFATNLTTATYWVIAKPYADMDDASDDISQTRAKRKNFTQTFERAIQITQSRKGIAMEAVVDELQHQIKLRTLEMKRELDMSVINGIVYTAGVGNSETRTMQGIINFIRNYDYSVYGSYKDTLVTQVSAALTISAINALLYKIWDAGGLDEMSDPIIVVGGAQQRVIASFEKELRRVEQGERQTGYYRDIFLSDMGKELPIVLDRWCPKDKLIVLDRARVALRALQGDSWHMEKMAKTGRSEKWQISGQYTIEVRNADKVHGLLYDLS